MTPDFATRPPKPKMLLFSSKRLTVRAVPASVQFGNMQVALDFQVLPGPDGQPQRATIYSTPKGSNLVEGELGPIPPGSTIRMYGSFNGDALEHTLEKLKNAGWQGKSVQGLAAGKAEGLGDVDCSITVDVKEYDDRDGKWYMREFPTGSGQMQFAPKMQVGFVNKVGGAAFKEAATPSQLADIDAAIARLTGGGGGNGASRAPAASQPASAPVDDSDIPF